jgi:hypothetical protein
MDSVGAVRKADRNSSQNFNFRGIDAVVNAVSPALRHYGVVVTPELQSVEYGTVEIGKNRTAMGHVRVVVKYTFTAEDGSSLTATVPGEAMDSGDKATAKAMSVAFRTALLQALALPTDEPDPDSQSYERAPAQAKVMDEATYARALAAIQGAADEAAMAKIVDAFRGYAIKDEWEAALGEAVTDWHVSRA